MKPYYHLLGQSVPSPQVYTPDLLVPIERAENRKLYQIDESLPMQGMDIWHAYEVSFLMDYKQPVNGVLKLAYDAQSLYMVESKSLKLYLNSFNQELMGRSVEEALSNFTERVQTDLSNLLQTTVKAFVHQSETGHNSLWQDFPLIAPLPTTIFDSFKESPDLLDVHPTQSTVKFRTDLLRSNCKVTGQPDWGDLFVWLEGKDLPTEMSMLNYVVSFRNENHFHEEVVEMIYKRIWDACHPSKIMIGAIYTRRGGIDIAPFRANHRYLLDVTFLLPEKLLSKGLRQ